MNHFRILKRMKWCILACILVPMLSGCGGDVWKTLTFTLSGEKNVTSFGFSTPASTGVVDDAARTVVITVPYRTSVSALVATFATTGKSVTVNGKIQESGVTVNDFTSPVVYTVTAEDGTKVDYTVTVVIAPNSAKDITLFRIYGVDGTISGASITLTLPFGTDPSSLAPTITHTGMSISPASDTAVNFTDPVTYTVTADDGSVKAYTVKVTIAKSDAKEITEFKIGSFVGTISIIDKTITLTLPYGTNPVSLTPKITHTGGGISPASETAQNFTNPVEYTVTAYDGSTQNYTVTISIEPKISVTGLDLEKSTLYLESGDALVLIADVLPGAASIQGVTWTCSDNSVVDIVGSGSSITLKPGTAPGYCVITAKSDDPDYTATASCIVWNAAAPATRSFSGTGVATFNEYILPTGTAVKENQASPDSGSIIFPVNTRTASDTNLNDGTGTISAPFYMAETETTYELWNLVYSWAVKHGYTFTDTGSCGSSGCSGSFKQPVTNVSWYNAVVWCNAYTEYHNSLFDPDLGCVYLSGVDPIRDASWTSVLKAVMPATGAKGFRLPTNSEWEYAARYLGTVAPSSGAIATEYIAQSQNGGSASLTSGYCWTPGSYVSGALSSSDPSSFAWYYGNATYYTHETAQKTANALGLYDMCGNVFEWSFDCDAVATTKRSKRGGYFNAANPNVYCIALVYGRESSTTDVETASNDSTGFRWARSK